jgi:hypothetical protein
MILLVSRCSKEEGRRKKEEGGRGKEEGRRKKEEEGRKKQEGASVVCKLAVGASPSLA